MTKGQLGYLHAWLMIELTAHKIMINKANCKETKISTIFLTNS